jgi:predicted nucleic acid-binding protein
MDNLIDNGFQVNKRIYDKILFLAGEKK